MRLIRNFIVPVVIIMFLVIPVKGGFKLTDLGTLRGDASSSATAINDRGEIVGESVNSNGIPHAFSYRNGKMSLLNTNPSTAAAINDAGQIVGSLLTYSTNIVSGPPLFPPTPLTNPIVILPTNPIVIRRTNPIVILPTNPVIVVPPLTNISTLFADSAPEEIALPVSAQIVGGILPTNGETVTNLVINSQAVLFRPGLSINLLESTNPGYARGINNQGEIVGSVTVLNDLASYAFFYKSGSTTYLPVSSNATAPMAATGINNRGDIVGFSEIESGYPLSYGQHPFLYSHGLIHDLGTLGGRDAGANAINDLDEIVGWSQTTSNAEIRAFLYRQGQITDLGGLKGAYSNISTNVNAFSPPPIVSWANAINNWGMIVGNALTGTGSHAFIYENGEMTDLNDVVKLTHTNGPPGFLELNGATGINDFGQIVGAGRYWDGAHETTRAFLLDWSPGHKP